MNSIYDFDRIILMSFNSMARHSSAFDRIVNTLSSTHLLKGAVLAALLCWAWFRPDDSAMRNRRLVVGALVSAIFAIAAGRLIQLLLPFRPRPLHAPDLEFVLPYGEVPGVLDGWSSFPSDHAVLFFAVSAGLWLISRRAGAFAYLYSTLIVCLPRIYLGLHYPSDILAGAALGMLIGTASSRVIAPMPQVGTLLRTIDLRTQWSYPILFLILFEVAEMFDGTRALVSGALKLFQL